MNLARVQLTAGGHQILVHVARSNEDGTILKIADLHPPGPPFLG
jgi:hypothetical protein